MMMKNYKQALCDSQHAISIDDQFAKGFERVIKCCIALGDVVGAEQAIKGMAKIGSMKNECKQFTRLCRRLHLQKEKIDKWYRDRNYRKAGKHQSMKTH